jgi:hypothetical protein
MEILAELARLDHRDRREIALRLFEIEADAKILQDCDRRADEHFLMLDALEAQDAQTKRRSALSP